MSDLTQLLQADQRRRDAMVAGNVEQLASTLADDLIWTHSSGKTDGKVSLLDKIESKAVLYHQLDADNPVVSQHGDVMICHGLLTGRATSGSQEKALRNRFLSVWRKKGDSFEMLAWQSTGC